MCFLDGLPLHKAQQVLGTHGPREVDVIIHLVQVGRRKGADVKPKIRRRSVDP